MTVFVISPCSRKKSSFVSYNLLVVQSILVATFANTGQLLFQKMLAYLIGHEEEKNT